MSDDKIKALKKEISNLKSQWPAHSVPPTMLQRLDDLEEELEKGIAESWPGKEGFTMNTDLQLLHKYPLFSGLTEEQMQTVMQVCREECFLPDVTLFEEGQPAKEIFVLVEGEVEESVTAGEVVLTPIHPVGVGEIIGCPALVTPYSHRCTARSLNRIEVLAIDAVGLRKLFKQDCQLAISIQQSVIQALLERIGKLRLAGTEFA